MDSEAFICLYVSVDMTTFEYLDTASSFFICIFTFMMSRSYLKMKVMWPIFHTWAIFALILYIHVSNSWNICVRNFEFSTRVHLWPMLLHTNNVGNIQVVIFGNHICSFYNITLVNHEVFLLETSNFTPVYICPLWMCTLIFLPIS